jgi:hypothetical protein
MKRIILMAAASVIVAGCAANGQPRVDESLASALTCTDKARLTVSNFIYADSHMSMISISDVEPDSGFIIRLVPRGDFGDADITVTGTSANAAWISGSGTAEALPNRLLFVGCAPDDPAGTQYKFAIKVEKDDVTNILDPRARLIR